MSEKQKKHYRIASVVFREAWLLKKRTVLFALRFGSALKLAWKTVRCFIYMRYSKVYGVSFNNRQSLLKELAKHRLENIILTFKREPNNPADPNAIKVIAHIRGNKKMLIGYVSRIIAAEIAPMLDMGKLPVVMYLGVTGLNGSGFLGCNFKFSIVDK